MSFMGRSSTSMGESFQDGGNENTPPDRYNFFFDLKKLIFLHSEQGGMGKKICDIKS